MDLKTLWEAGMNLKDPFGGWDGSKDLLGIPRAAGVAPWIQKGQIDPFRASKGSNRFIPIGFSLVFIDFIDFHWFFISFD